MNKPFSVEKRSDGTWIIEFEAGGYPYHGETLAQDYPYDRDLCVHMADLSDKSIYVDAEIVNDAVKEYLKLAGKCEML